MTIPARTTLPAGGTLVITRDAQAFRSKFGTTVTPVELRQLTLSNTSDTVKLLQGATTVDMVAWGAPRPGWNLPAGPLCRPAAGKDTNTYLDWTRAAHATPGIAGCGQ